jgi:hypothetical protein
VAAALPFAGRKVCDCELVCAPATERPSPGTVINANSIITLVEHHLPISFSCITSPK